jgi:CheY-like chemotaxis protein
MTRSSQLTPASAPVNDAGSPWILVVDDDRSILDLVQLLLQAEGWTTQLATSAEAALKLVESAATPPRLLLCDVMMAGVDGLELARRLLARVPGLKAIVISAHLEDVSWWPEDLRHCRFISKPFKREDLIQAVKEALPA